jgi:uncharacterized HhH-GPD family protein
LAAGRSSDAVARELVRYGERLRAEGAAQVGNAFSGSPDADELLREVPEAFLIGVLFTQGISAERAWAAPYLLRGRLGHLDLQRLATEREAVAEAIARRPALHRFTHTMARWVSDAATRLTREWGSDASRIWAAGSSAAGVALRLSAFDGIGRKKAAMAVEILTRHLGVPLSGMESGTVAYDTHVRRVFLRSGLVEHDTFEEIVAAATWACPDAPGTLDLPAWLIGRRWCRPKGPECDECLLGAVCPRLTSRSVEGVGSRRTPRKGPGGPTMDRTGSRSRKPSVE